MRLDVEKLKIPSVHEGGRDTIVNAEIDMFMDGKAIGVFKLHPDNTGAGDISQVRRDIMTGLAETFPDMDIRDFRYFEDQGPGMEQRYRLRTFEKGLDGQVYETKPVGATVDQGYSQVQFDDLKQGFENRELTLSAGQGWSQDVKLPPRPEL